VSQTCVICGTDDDLHDEESGHAPVTAGEELARVQRAEAVVEDVRSRFHEVPVYSGIYCEWCSCYDRVSHECESPLRDALAAYDAAPDGGDQ
jgi:hypothetical protein